MDTRTPNTQLTEAERIDRLRLIRSDNVGPRGVMSANATSVLPWHRPLSGVVHARLSFLAYQNVDCVSGGANASDRLVPHARRYADFIERLG